MLTLVQHTRLCIVIPADKLWAAAVLLCAHWRAHTQLSSLQALADEYKTQYERQVEENKELRSGAGDAGGGADDAG